MVDVPAVREPSGAKRTASVWEECQAAWAECQAVRWAAAWAGRAVCLREVCLGAQSPCRPSKRSSKRNLMR